MYNSYTHTAVVSIGRSIKGKAMSQATWDGFRKAVLASLAEAEAMILQHPAMGAMRAHDQVGVWDGQRENAATFIAFLSGYGSISILRDRLRMCAELWEQEAIGCIITIGTDHLVTP